MERYLCPCCGEPLLVHVRENHKIGFCLNCYQEMPLLNFCKFQGSISAKNTNTALEDLEDIFDLNYHNIHSIIQSSISGIWIIYRYQKTLFINSKMTRILGYTAEELQVKPFWTLIDENHPISQVLNSHQSLKQPEEYELKLRHKQGYWIWVKLSLTPLLDQEGQCQAYLMQVFDLTDLKQIEHQLRRRTAQEQAISSLLQVMRTSSSLQDIFTTVVNQISHLLAVTSVQIVQYIPKNKTWVSWAESKNNIIDLEQKKDFKKAINLTDYHDKTFDLEKASLPLKIATTPSQRSELVIDDNQVDNFLQSCSGAWLPIPLYCESSIWGCLSLVMQDPKYDWQSRDQTFIQTIADLLSMMINQAQLHTKLEQVQPQLQTLSTLDRLTQLPNRYRFNQYLNQTWQKLSDDQQHLTIILCHVDSVCDDQKNYSDSVTNESLK